MKYPYIDHRNEMKRASLLILLSLFALIASAQDYIRMSSGEVIEARVVEVGPETVSYKRLTNLLGPNFTVSKKDVFAIHYENGDIDLFYSVKEPKKVDLNDFRNVPRLKGFADFTVGGLHSNGSDSFNFEFDPSVGYQFNPYFFLGVGTGVGVSTMNKQTLTTVLLYGHTRVNITKTRISPYIDFRGGSLFVDGKGLFISPSVGVSMPVSKWIAINFALTYMANISSTNGASQTKHAWGTRFGFEF